MQDVLQQALQSLATHNSVARDAIIACAAAVVYLMCLAWIVIIATHRFRVTVVTVGHIIIMGVVAYALAKVLGYLIVDPRPYMAAHTQALIPAAHDNGFPSDHTLLAALLATSLWWIDRRYLLAFAGATVLVLLGRLGIGAHHTIDVLGSVGIVIVAALVAQRLPLPPSWDRPIVPHRGPAFAPLARREGRHTPRT